LIFSSKGIKPTESVDKLKGALVEELCLQFSNPEKLNAQKTIEEKFKAWEKEFDYGFPFIKAVLNEPSYFDHTNKFTSKKKIAFKNVLKSKSFFLILLIYYTYRA